MLNDSQRSEIRRLAESGVTAAETGRRLGLSPMQVYQARRTMALKTPMAWIDWSNVDPYLLTTPPKVLAEAFGIEVSSIFRRRKQARDGRLEVPEQRTFEADAPIDPLAVRVGPSPDRRIKNTGYRKKESCQPTKNPDSRSILALNHFWGK